MVRVKSILILSKAGLFVFLMLLSAQLFAQSPNAIPYQAIIRNPDGSVLANTAVTLTFSIHDVSASGTIVYQEGHSLTSNAQGIVVCVLGQGTPTVGSFGQVSWGQGAKFLSVTMNAGTGDWDLGTQQLKSVPYALFANDIYVHVSATGDTLTVGNESTIVPGISLANYPLGCTDALACNYNPSAGQDDGSCLYQNAPCDDGNANTGNDKLDANCQCVGSPYINGLYVMGNGVTDIDGNTYTTIIINGQEWMQQNLAVSKYRNGDAIPHVLSTTTWSNTTNGGYGYFNNNIANNATYGKLYNWYTVNDSRGVCPTGWHVGTDAEWTSLINFIDPVAGGGNNNNVAGGKMKSTGTVEGGDGLWLAPNVQGSNMSGFMGLPAGYRDYGGGYYTQGEFGYWWTATEATAGNVWFRFLYNGDFAVSRSSDLKRYGFSIRCVKD